MIDLNKVQKSVPNNLHMGMEWWAGEASSIAGAALGPLNSYWGTGGVDLFDNMTAPGDPRDNVTMPVMLAMGGKLDPALTYMFVNAANGRILERYHLQQPAPHCVLVWRPGLQASTSSGRVLPRQGTPNKTLPVYPAPMDHRGDGYFQIINMNQTNRFNVLDSQNGASGGAVVQNPQSYSTETPSPEIRTRSGTFSRRETAATYRQTVPIHP